MGEQFTLFGLANGYCFFFGIVRSEIIVLSVVPYLSAKPSAVFLVHASDSSLVLGISLCCALSQISDSIICRVPVFVINPELRKCSVVIYPN